METIQVGAVAGNGTLCVDTKSPANDGIRQLTMADVTSPEINKIVNYLTFKYSSSIQDRALTKDDLKSHLQFTLCKLVQRGYVAHYLSIGKILEWACISFVNKQTFNVSYDDPYTDEEGETYNPYEKLNATTAVEYGLEDFYSRLTSEERLVVETLIEPDEEFKEGIKKGIADKLGANRRKVRKLLASVREKYNEYIQENC